ncbi:MAG: BamA/OMP85 family outer membrane protein [Blastocatellia bacterium]
MRTLPGKAVCFGHGEQNLPLTAQQFQRSATEYLYRGIKDYYGRYGYIQAEIYFAPKFIDKTPEEGEVEITLEVDEGRQFALRRLEFIGNTHTRDVVMRRESLINEGDAYNKQFWDLSILRLNQLGLFEEIRERDAITRTNDRDQTVDIDLQVRERSRQQIQLNGGVSGYAGSFFGLEYSTNNLLGYGESLSFAISSGTHSKSASFGFTEPYLLGRPVSLGFQLFASKSQFVGDGFDFNRALQASVSGLSSEDADTLFTQYTAGGSVSLSGQLSLFTRKFQKISRFTRLGLSYSLTGSTVKDPDVNTDGNPDNDRPQLYSQPRIITSQITPSIYYNTKNPSFDPTSGKSLFLGVALSGGVLGGDVRTFAPQLEFQYFKPILRRRSDKPHVLAMRFKANHIRAYGNRFEARQGETRSLSFLNGIPIFERFFLGGEYDIRGYKVRSITPVVMRDVYHSNRGTITALKPDPSDPNKLIEITDPNELRKFSFQAPEGACAGLNAPDIPGKNCNTVRFNRILTPIGGDTQFIYNVEYRIPIVSVLSLAAFADVGTVFNARKYDDQITSSNFINGPTRVPVNPQGAPATFEEIANADRDEVGRPIGFSTVFVQGESQSFQIVRAPQSKWRLPEDIRSSLGLEFRVQMPVINVPFRLIFAYNPGVEDNVIPEQKTVFRFSIGRTF